MVLQTYAHLQHATLLTTVSSLIEAGGRTRSCASCRPHRLSSLSWHLKVDTLPRHRYTSRNGNDTHLIFPGNLSIPTCLIIISCVMSTNRELQATTCISHIRAWQSYIRSICVSSLGLPSPVDSLRLILLFLCNGLWNTFFSRCTKILLPHVTLPAMSDEVGSELLVFYREILATQIRDEEVSDEDTDNAADSSDDESPLLAQIVLNRREGPGFVVSSSLGYECVLKRRLTQYQRRRLPCQARR